MSDLEFAVELARRAGAVMLDHFQIGVPAESKADGTPVTRADAEINALVIDSVRQAYPGESVLGEEASYDAGHPDQTTPGHRGTHAGTEGAAGTYSAGTHDAGTHDRRSARLWVCDPLDGTRPYSFGVPTNLFSLALVEDGRPTLGVLYDPYLDRLYTATVGGGAHVNGRPIHVNRAAPRDGAVSLPGSRFGRTDTAALLRQAISEGLRMVSFGSITYESALVATGQLVGCVFPADSPWDIAAVKVIVEEAGGRVSDIYGADQRYDRPLRGAIVSNAVAHDALVSLAAPHLR